MPCSDYRAVPPGAEEREENKRLKERLDNVTAILCALSQRMEDSGISSHLFTVEHNQWWKEHKKMDELRLKEEARKRVARVKHLKVALERMEKEKLELERQNYE